MRVKFWGVRGSCPVPGPNTIRYGGNTACVEVRPDDGTLLIVDAGTGIRALGKSLNASPGTGVPGNDGLSATLLLSHTHHDHIHGFPFFDPLYVPGNEIQIHGPELPGNPLSEVVADFMGDAYHPAPLDTVQANVRFHGMNGGDSFTVGSATVRAATVNHTTICNAYRIEADGVALAYVTDTGAFDGPLLLPGEVTGIEGFPAGAPSAVLHELRERLVDLLRGCSVAIYDTMFNAEEMARLPDWGHSSPAEAIDICRAAGVSHLALFHHNPDCNDDHIDARLAQARFEGSGLLVSAAHEGETLVLR